MHTAIKTKVKEIQAWCLGQGSDMEAALIAAGKIVPTRDGYELFSQEARDGRGELAQAGDFFKVDSSGSPYPNARAFFLAHHRRLSGDTYEQLPEPLQVWFSTDPVEEAVTWLREHKGLRLSPQTPERFFEAPLWGTVLTAAADAALIFYSIDRDETGAITDASFNFVAADEFQKTYRLMEERSPL